MRGQKEYQSIKTVRKTIYTENLEIIKENQLIETKIHLISTKNHHSIMTKRYQNYSNRFLKCLSKNLMNFWRITLSVSRSKDLCRSYSTQKEWRPLFLSKLLSREKCSKLNTNTSLQKLCFRINIWRARKYLSAVCLWKIEKIIKFLLRVWTLVLLRIEDISFSLKNIKVRFFLWSNRSIKKGLYMNWSQNWMRLLQTL